MTEKTNEHNKNPKQNERTTTKKKMENIQTKNEALRGQNVNMYQFFVCLMLFSCLLPFAIIFVMFLLFDLIQILICHLFLFIRPLNACCSLDLLYFMLLCCRPKHISQLQNSLLLYHQFQFTIQISWKIINIRLKWMTLCFVFLCSFSFSFSLALCLSRSYSMCFEVLHRLSLYCRTITLPSHCTISFNEDRRKES